MVVHHESAAPYDQRDGHGLSAECVKIDMYFFDIVYSFQMIRPPLRSTLQCLSNIFTLSVDLVYHSLNQPCSIFYTPIIRPHVSDANAR